jgi:hypothetical protein
MRDCISDEFPISIFRAARFLNARETKLIYRLNKKKVIELNKARGHDYKIRDALGIFIEKINAIVVKSMTKYNTDRGRRVNEGSDFDFEDDIK